jgi:hypothetical protein
LEILAENIEGVGALGVTDHLHVDYFPDHDYLDPLSMGVVLSR